MKRPFSVDGTEDVVLAFALGLAKGCGDGAFDPKAFITRQEGAAFLAWESNAWRFWNGPMNKEPSHYSVSATEKEVRAVFPNLGDSGFASCPAVLDMGDKQLAGSLGGYFQSGFEDVRPAFLFCPAESGDTQDTGELPEEVYVPIRV